MSWRKGTPVDAKRWRKLRLTIFARDGYRCRGVLTCGKAGRLECDHIRPLHLGGAMYSPENLQTLCRGCHIEKTRRENEPPLQGREEWRDYVAELESATMA